MVSLKRRGRKVAAWENERRKLKFKFEAMAVTTCEARFEGCWYDNGLGFAHCRKRRNLKPHELSEVALLCNSCHSKIELLPEHEMAAAIRAIIGAR